MRLKANAGDAMGMNMLNKGSQKVADELLTRFPTMKLESLSGNLYECLSCLIQDVPIRSLLL